VSDVQKIIDALTSPIRREILWLIWEEELAAGAISAEFKVTAPTISEHLAVLREAGLVSVKADGSYRRYRARQEVLRGLQPMLLGERTQRWTPRLDAPERVHAHSTTGLVVHTAVDLDFDRDSAFVGFVDPRVFSRWVRTPITTSHRAFSMTFEWGSRVRGTAELVVRPHLVVVEWDISNSDVPVPGAGLIAYVRFLEREEGGSRVEAHQLVKTTEEAGTMEMAWSFLLGRMSEGVVDALAAVRAEHPQQPQ
jgi:DNA-binding transcriptional ArsR family regulator